MKDRKLNHERIETKKNRIVAAAHSLGFAVQQIRQEGNKTVISFKKPEKPLDKAGAETRIGGNYGIQ